MKNINCFYTFSPKCDAQVEEVAALINGELKAILERYASEGLIGTDYRFDSEVETFGNLDIPENAVPATLNFDDIFVPKSEHF